CRHVALLSAWANSSGGRAPVLLRRCRERKGATRPCTPPRALRGKLRPANDGISVLFRAGRRATFEADSGLRSRRAALTTVRSATPGYQPRVSLTPSIESVNQATVEK